MREEDFTTMTCIPHPSEGGCATVTYSISCDCVPPLAIVGVRANWIVARIHPAVVTIRPCYPGRCTLVKDEWNRNAISFAVLRREMQVKKKGACLRRSSGATCDSHSALWVISEAFGHVGHDSVYLVEKE